MEQRPVGERADDGLRQVYHVSLLWFLDGLRDFLHVHPIARIIGLALPTKTTIRKPDLGLVLNGNPMALADYDRSDRGVFDRCIQSLSASSQTEIDRDTIIKRAEYAAASVLEYYILDERGIETEFYGLRKGVYEPLPRPDGIIRSEVLPGFQFRIQDLYDQPAPPQMINDPIYSGFISPLYRQERLRAERAEARAEQYAALLKKAGLLPPE